MTADALHPVFFERNGGRPLTGSALAYLRRDRRIVQLTVARSLRAVEGERDGMVVGEIHAELAGETGGGTEPFRYGIAGAYAGAGEIDDGILHPIEHVNGAEGERAVMTRQAQLGFGARLAEIDGVECARGIRGICAAGKLAIPQRRHRCLGSAVRRMAERTDVRFAGGGGLALRAGEFLLRQNRNDGGREVMLGVADVRDTLGVGERHRQPQNDRGERKQAVMSQRASHAPPLRYSSMTTRPLKLSAM